MSQGGYAVVDVDEDMGLVQTGDTHHGSGLEFKTFLPNESNQHRSSTPSPPDVPYSPFNLAYYQTYFDVDTNTVLKRVGLAMIPRQGFIADTCEGQMDLYGPFWTLTTLILVLYTTSTLTASIAQYLDSAHASTNLVLLSTAVSTVYVYGLLLPALLWACTKWLGVGEWGLAEAIGLYGYAMAVYVPISFACLIPVAILRWILVFGAAAISGFFLVQNIYPVLATADNKLARLLIIAVIVLHGGMALAIKVLFFSHITITEVDSDPI